MGIGATMHYTNKYPEYPVIEDQIRRANIKRVVALANDIKAFAQKLWHSLQGGPKGRRRAPR